MNRARPTRRWVGETSKRTATERLPRAFAEADEMVALHIDPLLSPLRKTHRDFYTEYRNWRQVLKRPGAIGATDASAPTAASTGATTVAPTNPRSPPDLA